MDDDNVIYAEFGTERQWAQTKQRTFDGLIAIGGLYGDSEAIMRAKAEVVYQLLRAIVDDVPNVNIHAHLPADLSDEHIEMMHVAVRDAALKGIEVAMTHSVTCIMERVYDLCTSKLKEG